MSRGHQVTTSAGALARRHVSAGERGEVFVPGGLPRLSKLLFWLLRYPFQRVCDLALLFGVERSTASRVLQQAAALGLVETVHPACLREDLYYLSSAGRRLIAGMSGLDAETSAALAASSLAKLSRLLPCLPTVVMGQSLVYGLLSQMKHRLFVPGTSRRIRWHWVRDYCHRFRYHEHPYFLRTEALLMCHLPRAGEARASGTLDWYGAFVLVDAGLFGPHDEALLQHRLASLLRYRECEERTAVYDHFLPVLILAPTGRQVAWWHRMAVDAAERLHLAPLVGAVAVMPPTESIADPWQLAWQHLGSSSSCRLEEVLTPLPRAALPAGALPAHAAAFPSLLPQRAAQIVGGIRFTKSSPDGNASPSIMQRLGAGRTERAVLAAASLHLGGRHRAMLRLLYAAPLLSVSELAALLALSEESVGRYLSELSSYPLVEAYATAYGRRLCLSSLGLRWTASQLSVSLRHLAVSASTEDLPYCGAQVRLRADVALPRGAVAPAGATGRILSADARTILVRLERFPAGTTLSPMTLSWHRHGASPALVALLHDADLEANTGPKTHLPRSIVALRRQLLRQPHAVRHLAGIYGFLARLHRTAHAAGHRIGWWETGSRVSRRYRLHGRWHNLRPDAGLEYETGERRLRLWLEWDCGTMSRGAVLDKLETYATYATSLQWRVDGEPYLPLVLLVAPSSTRERWLWEAAGGTLAGCGLRAATTTAERISAHGPLAAIWWPTQPRSSQVQRRDLLALVGADA
jgi:DNA-binding MarR family transcriptional regulator